MKLRLPVPTLRQLGWIALSLCAFSAGLPELHLQAEPSWPGWRGPRANGSVSGQGYPEKWDSANIAWKVKLPGKGASSPVVIKDRIYLTTPDGTQDAVQALDFSGKELWLTRLGPAVEPRHKTLGSSCNSSPVTDGTGLYVYFKSGNFAALDLDGKVRWQQNLTEQFGAEKLFWDQGTSPVLTDKHVVLARMHGGESWVAGFDKQTGKIAWRELRNFKTPAENDNGYTTPVFAQHAGRPAFLLWGADHLTAHDASTGKQIWFCGGFNPDGTGYWPAIATPVIHKDIVIVPAGRDDRPGQARLHGIRIGGAGDVTGSHRVWKREDLGVFVTAPAEYEGRIYLLRHKGEVVCVDPESGRTLWEDAFPRERFPFYSSPVIVGGVLHAAREDGTVFSARIGGKFELLSSNALGERVIATPVAASGRLLIRGDAHLFCVAGR